MITQSCCVAVVKAFSGQEHRELQEAFASSVSGGRAMRNSLLI